ncbi:MAG: hypothetical protein KAR47_13460 [Planctomycetes bacterium]|nr:hypothetical protein [Planctomycetota bacterium]
MEKQTVLFATMAALFIATPHALGSGVEILSPNGGEELAGLSTFPITWQCDPNVITVDIEFSDSNGLSWSVIASDTPNDGQYDWLVPSISSDECLVRVGYLSPCDTKVVDVSDGVFAVQSFAIPLDPCTSKFVAFDGSAEDYFGMSISVSGDTCIIGSPGDGNGSVHVYRFDGKSWMFEQKLVASDGSRKFGDYGSVSISGDVCAVGGGGEKVFIYRFDGISWVEEQKLTLYSSGEYYDIVTVAIDGDVCVTRASERCMEECSQDSVQIFRFTGSSWVRETVLTPFTFPEHEFEYGWALSVNNDVCAIASRNWDGSVNHVDMFRFNGSSWIEENSLNAPPGQSWSWDFQGLSVSGNVCVVGDQHDDENGSNAGAAYVFRFDGVEWVYETKLLASDGVAGDDFGGAVSVDRDVCLVGADNAAYVFRYDGCSWYQDEKLIAPDASAGDNLGYSVSVSGGTFAVGTPYDDDKGTSSGSAYIFSACSSNSPYLIE